MLSSAFKYEIVAMEMRGRTGMMHAIFCVLKHHDEPVMAESQREAAPPTDMMVYCDFRLNVVMVNDKR